MVAPVRRRLVGLLSISLALAACGGPAKSAAKSAAPTTSAAASSTSETPTPTPTPTPTAAVAPPAGTVLTTYTGNGEIVPATGGFSILQSDSSSGTDQSTVSTYDVAGSPLTQIPAGGFTGSCGIADVSPGGRRLIITALLTTTDAQGVVAATYAESLTAFDARTGATVWTADLVPAQAQQLTCSSSSGELQGFSATQDGAYGALTVHGGTLQVSTGITLATGALSPKVDLLGALGNWLVTGTQRRDYSNPDLYVLTTPPTWKGLGSFSVGSRAGLVPMEDPSAITSGRFGGNSSASGLSSDGTQLFTTQATADNNGTVLIAYALPGMKQTWSQTSKDGVTFELRGSGGNVVVVERHAPDGTTTEGLNAHTGATLWSLPLVDVCGLSTTQMIVQVNSQTAVIDLPTGKQLSYSGAAGNNYGAGSCPALLPGGIAAIDGSAGVAITQVIDP